MIGNAYYRLDPGLRHLGWGVIDICGNHSAMWPMAFAITKGKDLAQRLAYLFDELSAIIAKYAPDCAAVEQVFVNKDAVATLKIGTSARQFV